MAYDKRKNTIDNLYAMSRFLKATGFAEERDMSSIRADARDESAMQRLSPEQLLKRILSVGFLYLMLVFFSSTPCGFLAGFLTGPSGKFEEAASGGTTFSVLAGLAYAGSALGIVMAVVKSPLPSLRSLAGIFPIWTMVAFAAASTQWSLHPDITISKSLALLGTTLAGVCVAIVLDARAQILLLLAGLTTVLFASLMMAVVAPSIAFDPGSRMLHGIFVQKNALGWAAAISSILSIGAMLGGVVQRGRGAIALIIAIAATLASQSAAALVAVLIGGLFYIAAFVLRRGGRFWFVTLVAMIATGVPIFIAAQQLADNFFGALGKDQTFNGRAQIWAALGPAIDARPYGGWGYNAFWVDPISADYMRHGAFFASNAQGGYHEILINLGWVGLGVFLIAYTWVFLRLVRLVGRGDKHAAIFFALLGALAIMGWTAPVFLGVNLIYWIIITISAIYTTRPATTLRPLELRA